MNKGRKHGLLVQNKGIKFMKIIFFGTGKFGVPTLDALLKSDNEIALVVTGEDKKSGRGWSHRPSIIKEHLLAEKSKVKIISSNILTNTETIELLKGLDPDIFVVVDYGVILSQEILDIPHKICINLHPSLLPKYRGASPITQVILNGDVLTANTVIKMNKKMDAGDIVLQDRFEVKPHETALELFERASILGADTVLRSIKIIANGENNFIKQDDGIATYAPKIMKSMGEISWQEEAEVIERKIRAFTPWPGTWTKFGNRILKIITAEIVPEIRDGVPGQIVDNAKLIVKTGTVGVKLLELQIEGKRKMTCEEFLRGHRIKEKQILGE